MIRAVLVDDEPPARVRMRQLLDAAGDVSVVGEAGNADEARAVIRDTRPDLLFLDVEMPEVRGTALAASLPGAAAVHRLRDGVRQLRARCDRRRCDRLPVEAGVADEARGYSRSRPRAGSRQLTIERDIVAASKVQSHLWPGSLPRIDGFDCAAASLPARGVGGDFYDLFRIAGARHGGVGVSARRCVRQGRRGRTGRFGGPGAREYGGAPGASRASRVDGCGRSRRAMPRRTARDTRRRSTASSMRRHRS